MKRKVISFKFKGKTAKERVIALAILRSDLPIVELEKLVIDSDQRELELHKNVK